MDELDFSTPFERESSVLSFLHEAPEDEGGADTTDTNTDPEDAGFEEAPAEENNDNNTDNDQPANEDNDDFTIDASDDGIDDMGGGDDTDSEDSGSGGESSETDVNVDNAAKKKDREIFDTLSPQEQKIKTVKLKELFMDLYNRCEEIINKLDSIGVDYEDLGSPIHKSIETLYSLKQMISTYLLYLFDSKSYIENDIVFNRFLTALNQIKLITKDMRDAHADKIEEVLGKKD